jgi:hypothetical protein
VDRWSTSDRDGGTVNLIRALVLPKYNKTFPDAFFRVNDREVALCEYDGINDRVVFSDINELEERIKAVPRSILMRPLLPVLLALTDRRLRAVRVGTIPPLELILSTLSQNGIMKDTISTEINGSDELSVWKWVVKRLALETEETSRKRKVARKWHYCNDS